MQLIYFLKFQLQKMNMNNLIEKILTGAVENY